MLREALDIITTSLALAPSLAVAQLEDAATRLVGIGHALALLGISERPTRVNALTGGRSSYVAELSLASGTYVLKQALKSGSVLAQGARLAGPQPYPAALSPSARIAREVAALRTLHGAGILVPRVLAANPAAAVMLVEKLPGRSLVRVLETQGTVTNRSKYGSQHRETTEPDGDGYKFRLIRTYRAALDRVHAAGLVLNDAHPGNALVAGDDVALIDLEFAEPSRDPDRVAFDLAYAAQYFRRNERTVFLARTDLRGLDRALRGYAPLFAYEANRLRAA